MNTSTLEQLLNTQIQKITPISGGDINQVHRIDTSNKSYFIKSNTIPTALDMFEKEAKGLETLAAANVIKIPEVLQVGKEETTAYLLLEHIEPGRKSPNFWLTFGRQLAQLHQSTSPTFGLDHSNYIGRLPQTNQPHQTWSEFYSNERLLPQMKRARENQLLNETDTKALQNLCSQLPQISPNEPPALTHGDLWSGNFLCGNDETPYLIDPAVSYAHREMDIAMSRLFGCFDAVFYKAYQDEYPLEKGFPEREEIYQLYYLLVHVNLFGGSYVGAVRRILGRF